MLRDPAAPEGKPCSAAGRGWEQPPRERVPRCSPCHEFSQHRAAFVQEGSPPLQDRFLKAQLGLGGWSQALALDGYSPLASNASAAFNDAGYVWLEAATWHSVACPFIYFF